MDTSFVLLYFAFCALFPFSFFPHTSLRLFNGIFVLLFFSVFLVLLLLLLLFYINLLVTKKLSSYEICMSFRDFLLMGLFLFAFAFLALSFLAFFVCLFVLFSYQLKRLLCVLMSVLFVCLFCVCFSCLSQMFSPRPDGECMKIYVWV